MMKCFRYDDGESVLAGGILEWIEPAGNLENATDPAPQPQPDPQLPPLPHHHGQRTTRLAVTEGPPSKPQATTCTWVPPGSPASLQPLLAFPAARRIATLNIYYYDRTEQAQS